MGAKSGVVEAEDPVSGLLEGYAGADGFYDAGKFAAEGGLTRAEQSAKQARDDVFGRSKSAVGAVYGGGDDPDQDFAFAGKGDGDVLDLDDFGGSIAGVDGGFHGGKLSVLRALHGAVFHGVLCTFVL